MDHDELNVLRDAAVPPADPAARRRALVSALAAFDEGGKEAAAATQGRRPGRRPISRAMELWREMMQRKLITMPAIASLLVVPIAGYATFELAREHPFAGSRLGSEVTETASGPAAAPLDAAKKAEPESNALSRKDDAAVAPAYARERREQAAVQQAAKEAMQRMAAPAPSFAPQAAGNLMASGQAFGTLRDAVEAQRPPQSHDRLRKFDSNGVQSVLDQPVSTFSIDTDTASYSYVRRALENAVFPDSAGVRVEELVNYFPYDWKGPATAAVPFNSTITVMPTPWNSGTKLMHIAIKGYDLQPTERPRANLVFLIDVSGSMNEPDKLPLLKSAFRILVNRLNADDTVSIVTYAGNAGTVLEPTKGSDKEKILAALDHLEAGGSTAGGQGIRQAYALARRSFVKDGVNRVMLATDGDFNVGQTDDDSLKRLVESEREDGVFLSVFGFGEGNYNDQLMQVLAQNGNGQAAYIDTMAEAEKALVEESSSTLFPIAKDVKIQVEFNPARVAEYRLIGYETRALKREDFNNDRVDAGDFGSGHAVTAIYEITPKGSAAAMMDDLRYQRKPGTDGDGGNEYAFVKIRYKLPHGDTSRLISTPVTPADEVDDISKAPEDVRFSVAVGAFGQKLRGETQTAGFGYDRIARLAAAARGADPYGYRAEFLSLVRLASALDGQKR
jgi:Ca-activated chloride channel family protein